MEKLVDNFEKIVLKVLLAMAMLFAGFQLIQLAWLCLDGVETKLQAGGLRYTPEFGKTVATVFFGVILVLSIAKVVMSLHSSHRIKLRIILIVCLVSLCRKILMLSEYGMDPGEEVGIAALALSVSASYFLVSRPPRNKAPA